MKKFTSLLSMLLVLCILLSMSSFAEDGTEWVDNPGADKILVDANQNTITFIYFVMACWIATPQVLSLESCNNERRSPQCRIY